MLFQPSPNPTSENLHSYSCSSSYHLSTRLPSLKLQPLSSVLHTAARLIKDLSPRDHITPIDCINYTGFPSVPVSRLKSPFSCIASTLELLHHIWHPCYATHSRGLLSSTLGNFTILRTKSEFVNRAFSISGPKEWNSLPTSSYRTTPVA